MEALNGRLTGARAAWAVVTQAWFTPVAVLLGLFNVLFAAVVLFNLDGESKGSGRIIGPVILLALAVALFAGLRLRWRSGQSPTAVDRLAGAASDSSRSTLGLRIGLGFVALLAVVAVTVGIVGSLISLIIGVVTLAGVGAVAARRRATPAQPRAPKRSGAAEHVMLADALIMLGTLPALAMWWAVVPAILALVVIGGVIGTGAGTRRRAAY